MERKLIKSAIGFIMACVIIVGMFPISAFAENAEKIVTFQCGDNVTCTLNPTEKTAIFSGTGEIWYYNEWTYVQTDFDVDITIRGCVEKIIISDGITSVPQNAFGYFYNTSEIFFSSTIQNIASNAFINPWLNPGFGDSGMYELKSIYVDENNLYYSSKDGVLYNKRQTELVMFPMEKGTKFVVPDGIAKIGDYAFAHANKLESVILPESIVEIGDCSFEYCKSLKEVSLPKNCTNIGDWAFFDCESLVNINIPMGVRSLNEYVFGWCISLQTISLPSSIEFIDRLAFSLCTSLSNIEIPEAVYFIGDNAFDNCDSLQEITIPKNVTSLDNYNPCPDCDNLKNIYVDEGNEYFRSIDGVLYTKDGTTLISYPAGRRGEVYVKNGTKIIGGAAFDGATKITNVALPETVEEIGASAFGHCTFQTIDLPHNLNVLGNGAFVYSGLRSIIVPENVNKVGYGPFNACDALEEITFLNPNCPLNYGEDANDLGDFALGIDLVVYGYKGSTAEKAAKTYNKTFINIDTYSDYYEEVGSVAVVTRNQNGTTLSGCTITVGDKEYVAESHMLFIDVPSNYTGEVTVSKDGYITSSLPAEMLKKYNFFVMYPTTETMPVTQHYLLRDANSSGNGYVDLLRSSEYIYDLGSKKHDIYIDVNPNGHTVKSIYLLQGKKKAILKNGMNYDVNTNGLFNSDGGTIYLCIETSDRTVYKTKSNIVAAKTRVKFNADVGGAVSGVVDEDLSAVGGWSYNGKFNLGDLPVSITIEENKVKGTIGIKGSDKSTATWYEAISGTIKKHEDLYGNKEYDSETIEELEKSLEESGGDIVEGYCSFGIDVSGSIIGYIEANWNSETAKLENIKVGLIFKIGGKASYTRQSVFVIGAIPVPYYWTVEIDLELAAKVNGKWEYGDNNKVNFSIEMPELSIDAELTGSLCLGIDKIVGGGGKAKGGLTVTFTSPDYSFTNSVWELSYEVGLTGQLAGFSSDLKLKDGTYQIYLEDETAPASLTSIDLMPDYVKSNRLIASTHSLKAATYNNNAGRDGNSSYTFKSNGYTYSTPAVASLSDGTAVMVWVDYDNERSDINKTALFYSVFDPNKRTWSSPLQVENDGTADDFPVLKKFNNTIYLVWNDADKALSDNATFADMLSAMGVSYAKFNGSTFTSVSSVTGKNGYMDICADVAIVNGCPTVVWLENQENNIFGQSGINTIMVAVYNNGTWDKRVALGTSSAINSLTVAEENGTYAIYYSADVDGTTETFEDYEIFKLHNGETIRVTNNAYIDTSLSALGKNAYWIENDSVISSIGDVFECEGIGNKYIVIENGFGERAIIYAVNKFNGYTEYMLCKETDNGFGAPVLLTSGEYISGGFDAYWSNNTLVLISNEINAEDFSSSINVYEFSSKPNLAVKNAYYDQYTLVAGGQLRTTVTVKNEGFETARGYTLYAYAGEILLSVYKTEDLLLPGQKIDKKIFIDLPQNVNFSEIKFYVNYESKGVSSTSDTYSLALSLKDISLENAIIVSDKNASSLMVSVVNRGISDLSNIMVYLRKDTENGEIIGSYSISEILSRQEALVQFDVSDYSNDIIRFYVTVDALENEKNIANNSDFASFTEYVQNDVIIDSAYDLYDFISVGEYKEVEINQDNPYAYVYFTPEEDGYYVFYSISDSDTYGYILDAEMNELASDDDSGEGYNFRVGYQMKAGETYILQAQYLLDSKTGVFSVKVTKRLPAESIVIEQGNSFNGYVGSTVYFTAALEPDDSILESLTWKSSDESVVHIDEYGYAELLTEGTATVTVESENGLKATCEITVESVLKILVNERKTVNISTGGQYAYYSFSPDEDGYYAFYSISDSDTYGYILDAEMNELASDDDSGEGNNFRVDYQMKAGETYILQARFYSTLTDGSFDVTVEKAKYITALEIISLPDRMEYVKGFVNNVDYRGLKLKATWSDDSTTNWRADIDSDYIEDQRVYFDSSDVDEDGIIRIACGGKEISYTITLIENLVESIEVVSGEITCIENIGGYESDNGYHYYYDTDEVVIKINYTDGTFQTAGLLDMIDGYGFYCYDNQYTVSWTLGGDNYLTISYLDASTQLPVLIIANPVDRIVINSAPIREYVYGDTEYGNLYSDDDYNFYPRDLTGLSFTVYYTDGTSKTFTDADIKDWEIDGFGCELNYNESNPEIGNFPVTFTYIGKSAEYTVVLKESTVISVAVTKYPNKMIYKDGYLPDFIGMELTITYTNGTTKVVTVDEDNLIYDYKPWWGLTYKVVVDGYTLSIEQWYDYDGSDFYYVASYLGKSCEIRGITFTESKEIRSVVLDNVSRNGDGMTINITYIDDTTETLVLDIAAFYDYGGSSVSGYGKTENGLLYYAIDTQTDTDGNVIGYKISILGQTIMVESKTVLIGDVDGDGSITNKDVTMLRRYLVGGWNSTIDLDAADVDGDGSITNKDVTLLRRYLVGGWNVTLG